VNVSFRDLSLFCEDSSAAPSVSLLWMRERAVLLRLRPGLWSVVSLPTESAEALREGGPTNRAGAGRR